MAGFESERAPTGHVSHPLVERAAAEPVGQVPGGARPRPLPHQVMLLQQAAGNRAVTALVEPSQGAGTPGTGDPVAAAIRRPVAEARRAAGTPATRTGARPGAAPVPETGALAAADTALAAVEGAPPVPDPAGAVAPAALAALDVPSPPPVVDDPDAAVVFDAMAGGQAQLEADTTAAVAEIQASLVARHAETEAGAQAQIVAARAGIAQAGRRIQASVSTATTALQSAGEAQRARLDAGRTAATDRAAEVVGAAETTVRDQATARGDEAVAVAREESDTVRNQVSGAARRADDLGRSRAAGARDEDPDVVTATRRAAVEISRQTSGEVRGASGATADDLRNVGPEVRTDIVRHGDQFAAQLAAMLAPLQAGIGDSAAQASSILDRSLADGFASLAGIGTHLAATIAQLSRNAAATIRSQATAAKNAQAATAAEGIALVSRQSGVAVQGGRATADELVAQLLSRRSRRRIGPALAADAARHLEQAYGMSARHARTAGQQIAACFQESAAVVHALIVESAGASTAQAGGLAGQATGQVTGARSAVVSRLETLITEAVARGDAQVTGADTQLQASLAESGTGLAGSLARLRTELAGRGSTTVGDAERPVGDLGSRIDQGMERARERANRSWLENQLSDAWDAISDPGFWAGLVVGLLVTIAVVAICGTGIGALVLAGALAGAAAVAATTLTEHATGRRQGPIDWGGLGRDMAVGAAFGAVGGALGGGAAAAVLGRQVLSGAAQATARQTATNYVVQAVVGSGVGVLQNISGPTPWELDNWDASKWDKALLVNIGTNAATNNPVADSAVGGLTVRAREAAVASGTAGSGAGSVPAAAAVTADPAGGPSGPAAASSPWRRSSGGGKPAVPADLNLDHAQLPYHLATEPAANRELYNSFVSNHPSRETALLSNMENGEYVVVQGGDGVPIRTTDPALLVPPHLRGQGRWVLRSHSRAVDASGRTPQRDWAPSGGGGDFHIAAREAGTRGRPFESEIRVATPAGPDITRFGYEPHSPLPYHIDMPSLAAGRETHRFATIEGYHDWYQKRFGRDLGPIPADFPGARSGSERARTGRASGEDEVTEVTELDLLPGDVAMLPDHLVTDPAANRGFYENFISSNPTQEAGLLYNMDTGEYLVVQGDRYIVDWAEGSVNEVLPPDLRRRGHWELRSHSHAIDASGYTPQANWAPSGGAGDFHIAAYWAKARGRAYKSDIRITTRAGQDVTWFGYDPGDPLPYHIDMPSRKNRKGRKGERETRRFATIEDYHGWYKKRYGHDLREIRKDFAGARRTPARSPVDPLAVREDLPAPTAPDRDATGDAHPDTAEVGAVDAEPGVTASEVPQATVPGNPEQSDLVLGDVAMLPDDRATDPVANRVLYENFLTADRSKEVGLIRNMDTEVYVVIQGTNRVDLVDARVDELVPPHLRGQGRWVLESHSHPVDESGLTPRNWWVPSGARGDFGYGVGWALDNLRPFQAEIRIETPAGPTVTRFGYDPGDPRPYFIDMPSEMDGRETHRFATIEDYHDWYKGRYRVELGPIPDDFRGARRAPAPSPADPLTVPEDEPSPAALGLDAAAEAGPDVAEAGPDVAEAGPDVAEAGPDVADARPDVAEAEPRPPDWEAAELRDLADQAAAGSIDAQAEAARRGIGDNDPDAVASAQAEQQGALAAQEAELARLRDRLKRMSRDPRLQTIADVLMETLDDASPRLRSGEPVDHLIRDIHEGLAGHVPRYRDVDAVRVERYLETLRRQRTRARGQERQELDAVITQAERLAERLRTDPSYDGSASFAALRRGAARAGAEEYAVHMDLAGDPVLRAQVEEYFRVATGELVGLPGGEVLRERLLAMLAAADELNLTQSPRQGDGHVADTAEMRVAVLAAIEAGRYPPEYVAEFEAARRGSKDGWPRTPGGGAWEVDHVLELWVGGPDNVSNYMALDPRLHDIKSDIFERFRWKFRDELRVVGEQVDVRESGRTP